MLSSRKTRQARGIISSDEPRFAYRIARKAFNPVLMVRGAHESDEAPGTHKKVFVVIKNQADLTNVLAELSPLGAVKGCRGRAGNEGA